MKNLLQKLDRNHSITPASIAITFFCITIAVSLLLYRPEFKEIIYPHPKGSFWEATYWVTVLVFTVVPAFNIRYYMQVWGKDSK